MDYGRLIKDAWSMAWRHKFLWLIGMFAPSSIGSCSGTSFNSSYRIPNLTPTSSGVPSEFSDLGPAAERASTWLASNAGVIVVAIIAIVILVGVFLVLSLIAQGGMVRSTSDLSSGSPSSFRTGLRAGLRYFWRYLGLWAITTAVALALAIGIAVLIVIGVVIASAGGPAATAIVTIAGVLIGIPLVLVAIVGSIPVGIILAFARRAIVIEGSGPISAIGVGFRLLRRRLGQSLLAWLVSLGLGIGIAIATFVAALVVIFVLAIPALIGAMLSSWSPVVIAYVVVAGAAFLLVAWVVGGAVNSLFWSYWTLAYLRLSGEAAAPAETPLPTEPPLAPASGTIM